jgi:DNA end-binding protein Ku
MPPRSMWKGAISFGLVTIPVSVFPATEEKSVKFNQLHDEDMGRIRYKRVCEIDGDEVPYEHIVKGFEIEKDRYVVLTDEDFDKVPVESSRTIDIQQFVNLEEIDPILYKKSYYLVPDETGAKAYALLRRALEEESKVGISKVSFRDKEHLAALRFKDDAFVLETMYWPDEIRPAEFETLHEDGKIREQEIEMAKTLIENLSEPWNPAAYRDEYREALLELVEKKAAGEEIEEAPEAQPARVVDLMEALRASVEAVKKGPQSGSGGAEKSAAKKSSAKKSAAKSSAKKTAAPRKKAASG